MQDTGVSYEWFVINRLEYCVDFKITIIERKVQIKLQLKEYMSMEERGLQTIIVLEGE